MDKKKVMCHIDDAVAFLNNLRNYVNGYNNNSHLTNALKALGMARDELKKSDWISVDDKLPSYEEAVLVTSNEEPEETYFSHRTNRKEVIVDKHQFATYRGSKPITHWRRIDKLEE